jgi:hypothetical protein
MTRAEVDAWADAAEVELLCADGLDAAILGIGRQFTRYFVVYDVDVAIQALVDQGMDEDEAQEWFEVNVVGAWVGEATPCFVRTRGED